MFLSSYEFTGDPDELLAGYSKLMASFPLEAIIFHVCVRADDGIRIIDGCPTRADFVAFSTSPTFVTALDAAGLPRPTIVELGTVQAARTRDGVLAIA
jgi:hypothetical protein